jgi:hypothetical protein
VISTRFAKVKIRNNCRKQLNKQSGLLPFAVGSASYLLIMVAAQQQSDGTG